MSENTLTFTYTRPLDKKGPIPAPPATRSTRNLPMERSQDPSDWHSLPDRFRYDDVLQELNKLFGLDLIKSTITELAHFTAMQQFRKKQGFKTPSMALHMAFLGNPGTGKTTVARVLARLFHRIGILKEEKFREVSRVNLVGNYVGHTAKDTLSVLEEAKGGILFIDEAYSLVRENPNDFGIEAVETLLKFMEDHRNEIIVIFAGYREPMLKFLGSNPGLASRIPYQLHFEDYTLDELLSIAEAIAKEYDYTLSPEYKKALFTLCFREKQKSHFSNGRFIRNCIEKSIRKQNARLANAKGFRLEEVNWLLDSDL